MADHVFAYAADLVRATRPREAGRAEVRAGAAVLGAGPRACQYLILGGKAAPSCTAGCTSPPRTSAPSPCRCCDTAW